MPVEKKLKILSIETSCDETAAAVLIEDKIKSNIVFSQLKLHQKTDGIVPEVASRNHTEKINLVVKQALKSAKLNLQEINLIAVTNGPGLIGSLLVGIDAAKTLAFINNKPILPINHIEAHIYANFINKNKIVKPDRKIFPVIALVVSGGHTLLILMRGHGDFKIIGSTIDDAAGEAFDKAAKILNLPYPGGPSISKASENHKKGANKNMYALPRPMIDNPDFNFSFSGLKTALLYMVKKKKKISDTFKSAIAHEFQQAIVEVLVAKTIKAARKYQAKSIMLGGGVAANKLLREKMKEKAISQLASTILFIPNPELCTDNAVIIGACAYFKKRNKYKQWKDVKINLRPSL